MQPKSAGWPAPLTASAFNWLGQCANSPGNRAECYTELAISSLTLAVTIASTHNAYPWRDGQAEWAWVAWLDTKTVYPQMVAHLSTNPAQRRVTLLTLPTMLSLSQTARKIVPDLLQRSSKFSDTITVRWLIIIWYSKRCLTFVTFQHLHFYRNLLLMSWH